MPASSSKDRKNKCISEQYVRERKSNAQKQFAYNKLKNEKQVALKDENRKSISAPKRPPQPQLANYEKKEQEGMLIDLTSPQQKDVNISSMMSRVVFDSINDFSILDAPIDVPTEGYPDAVRLFNNDSSKPEPPPYQSPPTYMNTFGLNKLTSALASNKYGNLDPFDTSHIGMQSSTAVSSCPLPTADDNLNNFNHSQMQICRYKDSCYMSRPRPNVTSGIDDIIQNKLESMSPKCSQTLRFLNAGSELNNDTTKQMNQSDDNSTSKVLDSSGMSESLKVNLSLLTLNDTDTENHSLISAEPKLDKSFLAELEKEIYKNGSGVSNVNVYSTKSNEYATMNEKKGKSVLDSLNWLKNDFSTNSDATAQLFQQKNGTASIQSPAKYNNEPIEPKNLTMCKESYNLELSSAESNAIHAPTKGQMDASNETVSTVKSSNQAVYTNHTVAGTHCNNSTSMEPLEQKYNFLTSANYVGGTYSVSSEIYGSVAGMNMYDVVASNNSNYYQTIQPNDPQSVIYDEVAVDEIRPHRPAPCPPTPILSTQQIQRRIERAQKEQTQQLYDSFGSKYVNDRAHSFHGEIQNSNTASDVNHVSKEKVNAVNSGTIKNVKIKQLLR